MPRTIQVPLNSPIKEKLDSSLLSRDSMRSCAQLRRAKAILGVSSADLGTIFGITRQAVESWTKKVPVYRRADVARVADVADRLAKTFRSERIPQIAREPIPVLGGKSIITTLSKRNGAASVLEGLDRLASYVPLP